MRERPRANPSRLSDPAPSPRLGAAASVALAALAIAIAPPALAQCPPLRTMPGPETAVGFGGSVLMAPDPDPLRRALIIVGAPDSDQDASASPKGRAYVYDADGAPLFDFIGAAHGDELGRRIALITGPAPARLIAIGVPGVDLPGLTNAGAVKFFSAADGAFVGQIEGALAGGAFGHALDAHADYSGDGVTDIIVGAPGGTIGVLGLGNGRVFVHSGAPPFSLIAGPFDPPAGQKEWGSFVADAGPLPGGARRIVISAKTSPGNVGRVNEINSATAAIRWTLQGDTPSQPFGPAVALGDVDADGALDIVVGTPQHNAPGPPIRFSAGRVSFFSGATGALIRSTEGEAAGEEFGFAIADIGDFDGDGVSDFAISLPGAELDRHPVGAIDQISGIDGASLLRNYGPGMLSWGYGLSATPGLSVAGDARTDIAVCAPLGTVGPTARGVVFLFPAGYAPPDLDHSGAVGSPDLAQLLGAWGVCPPGPPCLADLDNDGAVSSPDVAQLLGAWGACP